MAGKKVYFYKMELFDRESNTIHHGRFKEIISDIITGEANDNGDYKSLDVTSPGEVMRSTFDIYDYEDSRLFGSLCKQKQSNLYRKHDYRTGEMKDVLQAGEDDTTTGIGPYTYCILDYALGVLSLVGTQGAPNENVFEDMFYLYNDEVKVQMTAIPNRNAIDIVYYGKEPKISNVEIEIPLPEPVVLERVFGWNPDSDILQAISNRNLVFTANIKARTGDCIANEESRVKGIIDLIMNKKDTYGKAKIKAKTKSVKMKEYNLHEEYFSYPIDISTYRMEKGERIYYTENEITDMYREKLIYSYYQNKDMIEGIIGR